MNVASYAASEISTAARSCARFASAALMTSPETLFSVSTCSRLDSLAIFWSKSLRVRSHALATCSLRSVACRRDAPPAARLARESSRRARCSRFLSFTTSSPFFTRSPLLKRILSTSPMVEARMRA